jgi:hypothetical protein
MINENADVVKQYEELITSLKKEKEDISLEVIGLKEKRDDKINAIYKREALYERKRNLERELREIDSNINSKTEQ